MKKHLFTVISLIIIIATIFSGCTDKPNEEETTTSTTEVTTTEEVKPVYYNRLTGESGLSEAAVGKRPVAVMVNNIKASLPQYGIYDADILFEILVEGGITRLMALYGDQTKVPKICSVRSCRYYYPIFAHGFDAVYFCFGSNESLATPTLKRIGIDYFDGNQNPDSLVFGRDADRLKKYSSEHTAYVNGKKIPELLKKYDVRTDYLEGKDVNAFNFRSEDAPKAAGTITADTVQLDYSIYYDSTFDPVQPECLFMMNGGCRSYEPKPVDWEAEALSGVTNEVRITSLDDAATFALIAGVLLVLALQNLL